MESYLTEIKQLRIPRPKFEPNGSSPTSWRRFVRPFTPPRDYNLPAAEGGASVHRPYRPMDTGAKEFRTSLHNDL